VYLTAQRVRSLAMNQEGVNAFLYDHGSTIAGWTRGAPPFTPEQHPGRLRVQRLRVAPPGNQVRSYLDILTQDSTPSDAIRSYLDHFIQCHPPQRLPATWATGDCTYIFAGHPACWFHCDMEAALIVDWDEELRHLLAVSLRLRDGGS